MDGSTWQDKFYAEMQLDGILAKIEALESFVFPSLTTEQEEQYRLILEKWEHKFRQKYQREHSSFLQTNDKKIATTFSPPLKEVL